MFGVDVGGLVALLSGQAQQLLVVATGRFADHTQLFKSMVVGVVRQFAELFFDLVGLPIDRDCNFSISCPATHVNGVAVKLLFTDVEADHKLIVGVYLTGKILYLHGRRSHCSG